MTICLWQAAAVVTVPDIPQIFSYIASRYTSIASLDLTCWHLQVPASPAVSRSVPSRAEARPLLVKGWGRRGLGVLGLNSFKGGYLGDYIGDYFRGY